MKQRGTIRNIAFDNIDVLNAWQIGAEIRGFSEQFPIEGVSPDDANNAVVKVFDRSRSDTGLQQDVTHLLIDHGPGNFTYSAAICTESDAFGVHIGLRIVDADGTHYHPSPAVKAGPDAWENPARMHNLSWNGLKEAWLYIESQSGHLSSRNRCLNR